MHTTVNIIYIHVQKKAIVVPLLPSSPLQTIPKLLLMTQVYPKGVYKKIITVFFLGAFERNTKIGLSDIYHFSKGHMARFLILQEYKLQFHILYGHTIIISLKRETFKLNLETIYRRKRPAGIFCGLQCKSLKHFYS